MDKIRFIYHFVFYIFLKFAINIHLLFLKKSKNPLIVFDIDNTLALTRDHVSKDFFDISPNLNLCNTAQYFLDNKDFNVLILSVRPISALRKTKLWLQNNIKSSQGCAVFFTKTPEQKIRLLQSLKFVKIKLLIDDMSYHIGDEILLYHNALNMINEKKLLYLGISFINDSKVMTLENIITMIKQKISTQK